MRQDTKEWKDDVCAEGYVDRLRAALKAKKMTQTEFARICDCSPSNISAILNRKYSNPTPKYIWEKAKLYLNM